MVNLIRFLMKLLSWYYGNRMRVTDDEKKVCVYKNIEVIISLWASESENYMQTKTIRLHILKRKTIRTYT